jgi:hypothetical protein
MAGFGAVKFGKRRGRFPPRVAVKTLDHLYLVAKELTRVVIFSVKLPSQDENVV